MGNVLQRPAGALNSDEYIILVGNIPWRGRWQDLKDLVREITPNIQRVEIYLTADGRSRGFGYIIVKERDEAIKVVERLDGFEWHGRALMAKLGNEANPVPVLTQEPNPTSSPDGSLLPEYVPVPPLPAEYNTNGGANFSAYLNLIPSQLAAYNEWIATQAYHHYTALAHNAGIRHQEERSRSQQQPANLDGDGGDLSNDFQQLSFADGGVSSPSSPLTRDGENLVEEYRRQAVVAQRAAAFHSAQHHNLFQEELARFQDSSPLGFQSSSSSSSTPSSSSPYSKNTSRRSTPNQPTNSRPPSGFPTLSPPQQHFSAYPLSHFVGSRSPSSSMNYSTMPYLSQREQSPMHQQGHNMSPLLLGQGEYQLHPSFYNPRSASGFPYTHPMASPTSVAPSRSTNNQAAQGFPGMQPHQQYGQTANPGGHRYSTIQPVAIPPTPVFVNNASGVPVNLSHGGVQTESRGIFIGNLPYNTHWKDLRTFLSPAGNIIRCDVPRKPNNKGRGYATVLFASSQEAERACEMFNGTMYQGRQIRVRLDTYANTKAVEVGSTVASASTGSASVGGSGSGGNQSSFFTDGDVDQEKQKTADNQGGRKSSASV
ncbi:hypothetical protein TWF569_004415 [Orbilia oligospora]|uniref:RRM domain-containing protein n=1 Tax=Orbilia oligospora TaxID=2813651 RepID=A0A7C8NAP3_ORBOL|nr:hypothetical protein TWF706_009886 [Orbilia oligospora]KAF3095005.1 hypothetical protein TWF102_007404 [Orbilia oligospora]KAF3098064.1 hypothetical protein TWF103_009164 [Orbilia oligospora]KAF3139410.1 hypothetical protein TWF594_006700 [Orbilia oligospora]KAF3145156.1 hypothetical protein TWF703_007740 [Orbilia oligospora]